MIRIDFLCLLAYVYIVLVMRSFVFGLVFLLLISYLAHIYVTREFDSTKPFVSIVINNRPSMSSGLCECRCCLLSGSVCETFLRSSRTFHKNFSCDLCTDQFCTMNSSNLLEQCPWMYAMKASCYQHQQHDKSSSTYMMNLRPILQ